MGGAWRALTCHLCKSGGTEPSPGRLGREVLMHTAETSKAWDSLLPKAQEKLLRENGVSPGQTAVTKQPRNPEALTLGFMA